MLFGVLFHNDELPNSLKVVFGVKARSLNDAHAKVNAIYTELAKKHDALQHKRNVVEFTCDGIHNAADIVAWAGIESCFAYGKYKDKPFLRVRFTDAGTVISGGYITINDDPYSISTLHPFY